MADVKHETVTEIIETPQGQVRVTRQRHHKGISVVFNTDDVIHDQATGFVNFLRDYAVVGLAVGFIVGQQANAVMKQLVASFVDPWLQVMFGKDLNDRYGTVHHGTTPIKVPWGAFVYTLVEFFVVVLVIYLFIRILHLDILQKPKEATVSKEKK
jgi:large conductance mechanosensitive channel